ncbi:acyl carrier protein [Kitasatospora aureofaciens]|uniref:acyl carrier protein n=1 Tax=Kitasatospora aureofaciens TaxID=1894 RepID=UPI001C43D0A2|nr:acyl carrier protein [Kitasatospora aureofaciens]MBV6695864.1 acyl carrier protein [Kitasatospora aureofaciens]
MAEFTLDDLIAVLKEAAGADEGVDLDDILDVPFTDLGYDSLALFNTVNTIERDRGIALPDETVVEATTPRLLLDAVNRGLAKAA